MWQRIKRRLFPATQLPEQWQGKPWYELPLLSVDCELTGLDYKQADILSIGWVQAQAYSIELNSSFYEVISTKNSLNQSPVIHGLTEKDIKQGKKLVPVLEQLLTYATSHIWVFHHAFLDMSVLQRVCKTLQIPWPTIVTLDTMQLARYEMKRQHQVVPPDSATLQVSRQRHELPAAPAHNALDDAMATVELLYAQMQQLDPKGELSLADFFHTGAVKVFAGSD
ncbi:3'-5' exonuclease [Neptunicella sp.]|uniref:3'-5' exonuclease n=1 Tax=Neptunicella sp. TaxID=2125986 RepID=UPI003F69442D